MTIQPVDFQYSDDITAIDKNTFDIHMRLYKGYVDKFNEIQEIIAVNGGRNKANATYSKYRGLKRGETYALNAVILHELYFSNIGGKRNHPDETAMKFFEKCSVDFNDWALDFIACAKASRGWVVFCYDQRSEKLINASLDLHDSGVIVSAYPLIVIDMYEHAYFGQYGDDKSAYIDGFMKNIDWKVIKNRFLQLE